MKTLILLSTAEAAEILRVSPRHVRYLRYVGHLLGRRVGRDWTYLPEDVEELRKKREFEGRNL